MHYQSTIITNDNTSRWLSEENPNIRLKSKTTIKSSVIHNWKAKYLSNTCVNSFLHKIIYTIVLRSARL